MIKDDIFITVCMACERASCWQGDFLCEDHYHAGTKVVPVSYLKKLQLEHPYHWERDPDYADQLKSVKISYSEIMPDTLNPMPFTLWAGYHCGCGRRAELRRQNTAYADDNSNWVIACDECFAEIHAYWEDRWADFYRECM